jgi:predicted nucleotidyltransferase
MDNKLKIINHLGKNKDSSFTMHNLSKTISIPYATFYRTLNGMKELLTVQVIGKAKTLRLNLKNPAIKAYLTIASEEEKKEHLGNQPIILKISSELNTKDVVILFGSYAKGNQKDNSDIDLLIINKSGEKSISFSKYVTLFKKKINPIFVTQKEFKQMLKDQEENVGKQALRYHVVLNNPERFWQLVLE